MECLGMVPHPLRGIMGIIICWTTNSMKQLVGVETALFHAGRFWGTRPGFVPITVDGTDGADGIRTGHPFRASSTPPLLEWTLGKTCETLGYM